jgi:predicted ATPase
MITRAKFENFKALRDVEITFDSRLTVLVGPNGSGKTSVLQGLQFLGRFARDNEGPHRFRVSEQRDRGSQGVYGWETEPQTLIDEQILPGCFLEVVVQVPQDVEFVCEYRGMRGNEQQLRHSFLATHKRNTIPPNSPNLRQLRSTTHLQLDPIQLRQPSFPESNTPVTRPDGYGLATTMAHLLRKYPEQFQAVIDSLQQVIPNLVRIRLDLEQFESNPTQFADVLIFDFKGASSVSPASVSDGTMIVLGLLSVIFGPEQPKLILLDDLDHRLHPKAQMQLVDLLRKLLDQFPDLQIIATSHSLYILDKLMPNEVRVMAIKDDGSAVCARLEEHPKYSMWKDSMSPGEFWSHAGEDWVKELAAQTVNP